MNISPSAWQLKSKFISILLLVLLIPASSIFLLKEIEKSLVDNLKQNLLLSAKLYSLQLENNRQWFSDSNLPESEEFIAQELFVFPLQQEILLDGFFEEWEFVEKFRKTFRELDAKNDDESMALLLGALGNDLYLSLSVIDEKVIYPKLQQAKSNVNNFQSERASLEYRAEVIIVSFLDNNNIPQRVFISPQAPGKIAVKRYHNKQLKIDWRYTAYWVETAKGFNLELKFPSGFKPKQLQVRYYDVDLPEQIAHQKIIASSLLDLNPVVWPSDKLSRFAKNLQVVSGQRVWILDTKGRVMARQGSLHSPSDKALGVNPLIGWIFTSQSDRVVDTRGEKLRLSSPVIASALSAQAATAIETSRGEDFAIALAASPVSADGEVIGAVLIEENIARVQLLQRKTLSQLLYVMAAIIFGVLLLIGWYVSKLVSRISLLKSQVTSLVDEQGRMTAPFELVEEEGDEIDELNTAFQKMGNKLYEYHDYLEKLASRLSHELRTPIAIVRSSLDNLLLNSQSPDDAMIIKRALEGTQRLGEIITRMRQASGVKDAMQSAKFEEIDLNEFVQQLIEGFNLSFDSYQFEYQKHSSPINKSVSPDLLAELMDKLLSNAMDFSNPETPVIVELTESKKGIRLSVSNSGPLIAKKYQRKIFQSLVSIRKSKSTEGLNLGLGLYVVKLIAEFHGARVAVENRFDGSGVTFSINWPE